VWQRTEQADFCTYFARMSKKVTKRETKPAMGELRGAYARATLVFNAASADLILRFAANLRPSDVQIAAEEASRLAVITARRNLWAAYAKA
jgi:hypothetical protein